MWFDRWSGSIRFSFRSICAIFCLGNTSNSVFRGTGVRKGFLLPKWVKIFNRPFYMVLVFTKSNRKLSFAKNSFFFVDSAIFDLIDDQDLIGIFVKDLIYNRIEKFIFLKDRDRSVKWKNLIVSNPVKFINIYVHWIPCCEREFPDRGFFMQTLLFLN